MTMATLTRWVVITLQNANYTFTVKFHRQKLNTGQTQASEREGVHTHGMYEQGWCGWTRAIVSMGKWGGCGCRQIQALQWAPMQMNEHKCRWASTNTDKQAQMQAHTNGHKWVQMQACTNRHVQMSASASTNEQAHMQVCQTRCIQYRWVKDRVEHG